MRPRRKRPRGAGITPTTAEQPDGKATAKKKAKKKVEKKKAKKTEDTEDTGGTDGTRGGATFDYDRRRTELTEANHARLLQFLQEKSPKGVTPRLRKRGAAKRDGTARWVAMRVKPDIESVADVHAALKTTYPRVEEVNEAWMKKNHGSMMWLDGTEACGLLPDDFVGPATRLQALVHHGLKQVSPATPGLQEKLRHAAVRLKTIIHDTREASNSTITLQIETSPSQNTERANLFKTKLSTLRRGARKVGRGWGAKAGRQPTSLINEPEAEVIHRVVTQPLHPLPGDSDAGTPLEKSLAKIGYAKLVYTNGTVRHFHTTAFPSPSPSAFSLSLPSRPYPTATFSSHVVG